MEVTISVEINTLDDNDFSVDNSYYANNNDFFNAVQQEVNKNAGIADEFMRNAGNILNSKTAKFNAYQTSEKSNTASIYNCQAMLLDENEKDESIDGIIAKAQSNDVVVSIIDFNADSMDEEFEENLRLWIRDHESINEYIDKIGEEKVWKNEPTMDFVVTFKNNANKDVCVQYANTKIIGVLGKMKLAVLAEEVFFVEKRI